MPPLFLDRRYLQFCPVNSVCVLLIGTLRPFMQWWEKVEGVVLWMCWGEDGLINRAPTVWGLVGCGGGNGFVDGALALSSVKWGD